MSYEFNAIKLELTEKVRVCTKQTEQTGTKPTGAFCIKLVSFSKQKAGCRTRPVF